MNIEKKDAKQQIIFGWLYVSKKADGTQVVDHSGDIVEIEELEKSSYDFVLDHRVAGEMHQKNSDNSPMQVGRLVECICFTEEKMKAIGIPLGTIHQGIWCGFKIDDADAWKKVEDGTYKMLSFGGRASKKEIK